MNEHGNKIAIVGAGAVGSAYAFALTLFGQAREILLIDANKRRAEGEAMDLLHGMPLLPPCDIQFSDGVEGCADAGLIVIAAGVGQKPGETRLELVGRNLEVFRAIFDNMPPLAPDALILVVANPVDILTYAAYKYSGLPRERVLGSGTTLDSHRLRHAIAMKLNIDARHVHGYVVGEHGDSETPLWSSVRIGALTLDEFLEQSDILEFNRQALFEEEVKKAAYRVIERKGFTNYAIAVALSRLTTALLNDESAVLCVSSYLDHYLDLSDICLSVPTVIDRRGVRKTLIPHYTHEERTGLRRSARILGETLDELGLRGT